MTDMLGPLGARQPKAAYPIRVLVVDDSAQAREAARRTLEREGFQVEQAADGRSALEAVARRAPDLILLDLAMPGMGGLEVLARLRQTSTLPVIVLSGQEDENVRVAALDMGADDYVVKPFPIRELPARIRSVLRRARSSPPPVLEFGSLVVRLTEREVVVAGVPVKTTPREFDLLAKLVTSPHQVLSRAELLAEVWGSSSDWQDPATVTEHIRRLRRKIEADPDHPRWLVTVRGVGYRFNP
jgi:two-component system, OmpR family, phosphate regulon response regulator PhoB